MSMKENSWLQKTIPFFPVLGIWLLINLIQAGLTPLHGDEAYYWTYGWNPAFGYWDNAPLIGLFTAVGQFLLPYTEIGVRLLSVLASVAAIYVLWLLTDRKDPVLFFALYFGMFLVHAGGFMATPDAPLSLANALFLLAYQRFSRNGKWIHAIAFGAAFAMVFYSKYQGLMLVGMVTISQPRLWRKPAFWVGLLTASVLMLPGVLWQFNNDFATFRHHLGGKDPGSWEPTWTLSFVGGQFLSAGPVMGFLFLPFLFRSGSGSRFVYTLKIAVAGMYIFLFLLTFKVVVHANWAASALIILPLIVYDSLQSRPGFRKLLIQAGVWSCAILLLARVYLMTSLPLPGLYQSHFRSWEAWADSIASKAGDDPVLFLNSFQNPSRYAFHTRNREVATISNPYYHPTQFQVSGWEDRFNGRTVWMAYATYNTDTTFVDRYHGPFTVGKINEFSYREQLITEIDAPGINRLSGNKWETEIVIRNPYPFAVDLAPTPEYGFVLNAFYRLNGRPYKILKVRAPLPETLDSGDELRLPAEIVLPDVDGPLSIRVAIGTTWQMPYFGNEGNWVEVELQNN
jgi:hypothetical protein